MARRFRIKLVIPEDFVAAVSRSKTDADRLKFFDGYLVGVSGEPCPMGVSNSYQDGHVVGSATRNVIPKMEE